MYRWAERNSCRHQSVAAHFGEQIGECGTSCDVCIGADLLAGLTGPARVAGAPLRAQAAQAALPADQELFERLRVLRRSLADERDVPAYVVFSDATLREMAARKPTTDEALLAIGGVGPKKLEAYGPAFLEELRRAAS